MSATTSSNELHAAYCATKTDVLAALDALRQAVLNHGPAPEADYHWGHIGDLNALLHHLQQLPMVLRPTQHEPA
jgi:hypothetical protein